MSFLDRFRRPNIRFVRLSPDATLPSYGSRLAAGLDLYAAHDEFVPAYGHALIKTGIGIRMPDGYEAQIRARSGLALKRGIGVLNGPATIDPDYEGDIGVILFNASPNDFIVKKGDRIAQLVIARFVRIEPSFAEDDRATEARQGERGANGFGSTGIGAVAATGLAVATAAAPAAALLSQHPAAQLAMAAMRQELRDRNPKVYHQRGAGDPTLFDS